MKRAWLTGILLLAASTLAFSTQIPLGGVTVSPSSLAPPAGMLIWYRGDSLTCTGGCSGTNPVTAFVDKSTHSNNASLHGGATAGTYVASGYGGRPGVAFDGSTTSYDFSAVNLETAGTVCLVYSNTAVLQRGTLFAGNNFSLGYQTNANPGGGAKQQVGTSDNSTFLGGSTSSPDTNPHSACMTYASGGSAPQLNFYLDGSSDGSVTVSTSLSGTNSCIGSDSCVGTRNIFFKGTLYELLAWDSVLSAGDISAWFAYTSWWY